MRTLKRKPQRPQLVPCRPLSRVHYSTGQVLSIEDFTTEQNYFCEKLRRHNRALHQPGILGGLEVILEAPGVRVAPGFALDAAGNEICAPVAQGAPLPSIMGEVYVVLRYAEIRADPIPVPAPPGEAPTEFVPSRIQESFEIGVERPGANPTPLRHRAPRLRSGWRASAS